MLLCYILDVYIYIYMPFSGKKETHTFTVLMTMVFCLQDKKDNHYRNRFRFGVNLNGLRRKQSYEFSQIWKENKAMKKGGMGTFRVQLFMHSMILIILQQLFLKFLWVSLKIIINSPNWWVFNFMIAKVILWNDIYTQNVHMFLE